MDSSDQQCKNIRGGRGGSTIQNIKSKIKAGDRERERILNRLTPVIRNANVKSSGEQRFIGFISQSMNQSIHLPSN